MAEGPCDTLVSIETTPECDGHTHTDRRRDTWRRRILRLA